MSFKAIKRKRAEPSFEASDHYQDDLRMMSMKSDFDEYRQRSELYFYVD